MSNPLVDIIIVNWNSGAQLARCLRHVDFARNDGYEIDRIVVIDNASSDCSASDLTNNNYHLTVWRNAENLGFAAACNQGALGTRADYLNPDVYLCQDSLRLLVAFLNDPRNCKIGICGPKLVDAAGRTQRTCARFPRAGDFFINSLGLNRAFPVAFRSCAMTEWPHEDSRAVDQVIGACFLIRSSVFRQLKGFDERFFVYFEEVDLCLRCKQVGYDVYFLNEAKATHTGGGCSRQIPATRLFYSLRSRLQYARKHFSPISTAILCFGTLFLEPVSRTVLTLVHGSLKELRSTWEAYQLLYRFIAGVLADRTSELRFGLSRNQ